MRDLICGGCELADGDTTEFSPLSHARREHLRTGRDSCSVFARQSATSERRDQPENAGKCDGVLCQNSRATVQLGHAALISFYVALDNGGRQPLPKCRQLRRIGSGLG
jgi:hypothetical protein